MTAPRHSNRLGKCCVCAAFACKWGSRGASRTPRRNTHVKPLPLSEYPYIFVLTKIIIRNFNWVKIPNLFSVVRCIGSALATSCCTFVICAFKKWEFCVSINQFLVVKNRHLQLDWSQPVRRRHFYLTSNAPFKNVRRLFNQSLSILGCSKIEFPIRFSAKHREPRRST